MTVDLLTYPEAVRRYKVSRRTLQRWIAEGKLTRHVHPLNRSTRLDRAELENALCPRPEVTP